MSHSIHGTSDLDDSTGHTQHYTSTMPNGFYGSTTLYFTHAQPSSTAEMMVYTTSPGFRPNEDATSPLPPSTTSVYVLPLSTSITIRRFPPSITAPYGQSYIPTYTPLPDGSLLTSLYTEDLAISNVRLFGVSALLTLFIINVWIAATFLRRAQLTSIKDKTLFYLLLASQAMGPIAFASLLVPFFLRSANCTVVNTIALITTELSYAFLITAILGLKAYRCLNRSRPVIVTVAFLQLLIFALFSLDLPNVKSGRVLSGACNTAGKIRYMPIAVILTVIEAFFIGLCFSYAVRKSSLYPVAQGRLSIALSVAPNPDSTLSPTHGTTEDENIRRGWWDYVPQASAPLTQPLTPAPSIRRIQESLRKPFSPVAPTAQMEFGEKSPRRSAIHNLEGDPSPYASMRSNVGPLEGPPLPVSVNGGPTKEKERQPYEEASKDLGMVQMRAVIMNELISAGCIAASNIATAVVTAIGAQDGRIEFGTSIWLGAIWAFNSLLIMQSFSSVVRRHEKDAIVQQYHPPAATAPWARRRRDAVATFQPYGGVQTSSRTLAPGSSQPTWKSNAGATTPQWRDSYSWEVASTSGYSSIGQRRDRWLGNGTESETDAASIRRREGLREWALERDARKAAARNSSSVPPVPANSNPFADAKAVQGDEKSEEGDLGRIWELTPRPRPDVERGIIVREPNVAGRRRGARTDLGAPRRKSGGPPLPPSRRSSSLSMATSSLPPFQPEALERRPSVASSQASVEHSADEPLLSPRTFTRD